jgi:hypothetical protein
MSPFFASGNYAVKIAGAAMSLVAACGSANAFSVSDVTMPNSGNSSTIAVYHEGVDTPKLDNVWCRWGCRGGWGWRGPALLGGLAAGAIVGGALAAPYYGYGGPYYGGPYYAGGYYPGCWRSQWTPYGWRRIWVC